MTPENKLAKIREMATDWASVYGPGQWNNPAGVALSVFAGVGQSLLAIIDDDSALQAARTCWCARCKDAVLDADYGDDIFAKSGRATFIVCRDCGNKRCPRATFHENTCTGSNDTGQPGSSYEHVWDPEHVIGCDQCTAAVATAAASDLDIAHAAAVNVLAQTAQMRMNNDNQEPPQ